VHETNGYEPDTGEQSDLDYPCEYFGRMSQNYFADVEIQGKSKGKPLSFTRSGC